MNAITKMCNNVIFAMKRNAPTMERYFRQLLPRTFEWL